MSGVGFFRHADHRYPCRLHRREGDDERSGPSDQSARSIYGSFVGGLLASLSGFQHDSWLGNLLVCLGRRHSPAMGVEEFQGNGLGNR